MQLKKELPFAADIFIMFAIFIISIFLWNTGWLYPVKLFVVALHELSHGLAAFLMGGKIDHIQLDSRIGGYCCYSLPLTAGFFQQSIVAAAGYLGSMLWGAFIFIIASRTRFDRGITFFVALVMLVLSFYVIKTGQAFGIVFCFAFTLFLFIAFRWFPPLFHKIFLKSLGLISCLYAIIDIKEDLIDRSGIGSDADRIARLLGFPNLSIVIGISWIVLAVLILVFTLKISFKKKPGTFL